MLAAVGSRIAEHLHDRLSEREAPAREESVEKNGDDRCGEHVDALWLWQCDGDTDCGAERDDASNPHASHTVSPLNGILRLAN